MKDGKTWYFSTVPPLTLYPPHFDLMHHRSKPNYWQFNTCCPLSKVVDSTSLASRRQLLVWLCTHFVPTILHMQLWSAVCFSLTKFMRRNITHAIKTYMWPVSQNLSIWVGNDIQMKIIFYSPIKFSRAIFHSCVNKQWVSVHMVFNIILILRLQATCSHFCVEMYAFKPFSLCSFHLHLFKPCLASNFPLSFPCLLNKSKNHSMDYIIHTHYIKGFILQI